MQKVKAISYEDRERMFYFLCLAALASVIFYIYGINATARNVAQRGELEKRVEAVQAELATLEFQYIALKNSITLNRALSLGFQEVRNPLFVTRGETARLSFNAE